MAPHPYACLRPWWHLSPLWSMRWYCLRWYGIYCIYKDIDMCIRFVNSCQLHVKLIWLQPSIFWGMWIGLPIWAFSFNLVLYHSLPSRIQIGLILLIVAQLLVFWCILASIPSLGVLRNRTLFLAPPQSLSIILWPPLPRSCVGFTKCWKILAFFSRLLSNSNVTMSLLLPLPLIPSSMLTPSMWRWITILCVRRSFAKIFRFVIQLLVISLLIYLQRVSLPLISSICAPKPWCPLTPWFWGGMKIES